MCKHFAQCPYQPFHWSIPRFNLTQMATASGHVARLEARINALVPAEADSLPPLSWETLNQHHSFVGYLSLGVIPGHPPGG